MLAFDLDGVFAPDKWLPSFIDEVGYRIFKESWSILRNPHLPCQWKPPIPSDSYVIVTSRTVLEEQATKKWLRKNGLSERVFCRPFETSTGVEHKIKMCKSLDASLFVESDLTQVDILISNGINAISIEEYKAWVGENSLSNVQDIVMQKALQLPFDKPLAIIAIANGGVPFAVDLARAYTMLGGKVTFVTMVPMSGRYHDDFGDAVGPPHLYGDISRLKKLNSTHNLLVVDDAYDSGSTLEYLKGWFIDEGIKLGSPWALTFWTTKDENNVDYCCKYPEKRPSRVSGYSASSSQPGFTGIWRKTGIFVWD